MKSKCPTFRVAQVSGITSACAEKSLDAAEQGILSRNYLRMRGEETHASRRVRLNQELPPHARRRDFWFLSFLKNHGITSACAEKRLQAWPGLIQSWNYLRMRGEEFVLQPSPAFKAELPPHARRRGGAEANTGPNNGITSACAEKRFSQYRSPWLFRNYLRMRGEEYPPGSLIIPPSELPPHARRRANLSSITRDPLRNYLRMRGEEHDSACLGYAMSGITSACAEKSLVGAVVILPVWNYLRMRGEEPSNPGISIIP